MSKQSSKTYGTLVVSRHAESEWNALGKWTGWTDVNLSEQGHKDACKLGALLQDIPFDAVYESELKRTHQTSDGILTCSTQLKVERHKHSAINERNYGELTGMNKWEVRERVGEEAFVQLRRGWDYPIPAGETLKDVHARITTYYKAEILPRLKRGQNILVVGSGNSMRALIKHLEDISDEDIADLELPLGHVRVYQIDGSGKVMDVEERVIETPPTMA